EIPGLEVLADTSHAGLYLNAKRAPADEQGALRPPGTPRKRNKRTNGDIPTELFQPLLEFVRQLPHEPDLLGYVKALRPRNAQVSNAGGLLGEGLPYAEGDFRLDPVIAWLGQTAEHIVTETLEPDVDDAVHMRDAL